jgi:2-C-methyl-D-erythritol 4-phosphate cytidylyltransferase
MKKYLIVVAGGKGMRMNQAVPKQFMLMAGRPVLFHTLEAFYKTDPSMTILLVLPEDQKTYWKELCDSFRFSVSHEIVSGGETRFHSVKNGLEKVPEGVLVAVHDGVRPLVSRELIELAYTTADEKKAAYPVIPVTDSIRKYTDSSVSMPVDRSQYCLVQTPQVFHSDILKEAYEQKYREEFTDDVSVVESTGSCIPVMIEGHKDNIKITSPPDLIFAEALMQCRI